MTFTRYTHPSEMEPLFPEKEAALIESAEFLLRKSAELGSYFAPETYEAIAELVSSMNGYYSNLIEGHRTRPIDIEAALKHDFSAEPKRREMQLLHYAHLETQRHLEARLREEPDLDFLAPEFIRAIHARFYSHLPDSLRRVDGDSGKTYSVEPGRLRDYDVHVGRHLAPAPEALGPFLARFRDFYGAYRQRSAARGIVAAMAAHHRLAWVHPFGDGNGRVTRLVTHLWLTRLGAGAKGLWTLSRGLARSLDEYKARLAAADEKRLSDTDGRGPRSEKNLAEFCAYMIDRAIDQVDFMRELLDLRQLEKRLLSLCAVAEQSKELPKRSGILLRDVMLRGAIPRGEAARILNVSARTAQATVGALLKRGLLQSPSAKGRLTIGFPGFICAPLFPDLYPAG